MHNRTRHEELASTPNLCFILGAGFSCAYSEHAPTMANFLGQAQARDIYKPNRDHTVLAAIGERYFGSATAANVEDLATFLLTDFGSDPVSEKEQRMLAYDQLMSVICQTLAFAHRNPRSEEIESVFKDFANFVVRNETCVITFNYDLILDQLLRNTEGWFPIDGYGVRIPLSLPGLTGSAVRALEETGRADKKLGFGPLSRMALLKLHGSLNWGIRRMSRRADNDEVMLGFGGAIPFRGEASGSETIAPIESTSMGRRLGRSGTVTYFWRPFIVPPDIGREPRRDSGNLLREIWYTARWLLHSASEIHVLGYSLPPSDFEADALIREGLHGPMLTGVSKRVIVVNKDPSVVERFKRYRRLGVISVEASSHNDVLDHLQDLLAIHDSQSRHEALQ